MNEWWFGICSPAPGLAHTVRYSDQTVRPQLQTGDQAADMMGKVWSLPAHSVVYTGGVYTVYTVGDLQS